MAGKRAPKRLALIIASYEYQDDSLRQLVAPAQDAEALARVLQAPDIGGFQVQTLLNEPSHKVNRAIEAFFVNRKRDDLLLLYFSGHGIKDDWGRLYFATADTRRSTPRTTAIPASLVNDVMTDSRSRRQVLLLDCCYSGAFAQKKADQAVGVQEQVGGRGRVVLTSSNAVQYSFEGDEVTGEGVRSVFTSALVRGLETGEADRDKDGRISLDELYDYVYEQVVDETSKQRPKMFADVEGKIVIARNPHLVIEPAELPTELQQVIENPFAEVRAGAVSALERLLHGSDEGLALAARQALTQLVDDDSRRVSGAAARALSTVTTPTTLPPAAQKPKEPSISPTPRPTPKSTLKAQKQLRRWLSSVPTWIWAVVGVAAVVLLLVFGSLGDWGATGEPTPAPTEAPISIPTIEPTSTDTPMQTPTNTSSTVPTPWIGPCRIESFEARPTSPQPIGSLVLFNIHATCESDVRAIRLLINDEWYAEKGGHIAPPDEFVPTWQTKGLNPGHYEITAEVATWGDDDWEFSASQTITYTLTISTQTRPADGMAMVYVPGGTFQMGSDDGDSDEQPVHTVTLDAFWIDQTEVTNAQYALCVADGECEESALADDPAYNGDNYPVVGVSWNDAADYCAWAGAQLPTEAQWEYAARGEQGYIYPWGSDTPTCELAQFGGCPGGTIPVGSLLDGASWCEALDMAGNVWEWVADWYGGYPSKAQTNPTGPTEGEHKVLRGGSFYYNETNIRASGRYSDTPTVRTRSNGFRCGGVAPGR